MLTKIRIQSDFFQSNTISGKFQSRYQMYLAKIKKKSKLFEIFTRYCIRQLIKNNLWKSYLIKKKLSDHRKFSTSNQLENM